MSRFLQHFDVEAIGGVNAGQIYRCTCRRNLPPIVAGDYVGWQATDNDSGVIEALEPRKNLLQRPDNFGRLKTIAANVDQMLITIASRPAPQPLLVDRYLAAAELLGIRSVLVLNKVDLISRQDPSSPTVLLSRYQNLGYKTLEFSCKYDDLSGLQDLLSLLNHQVSIVVGQSGVGKSSIIKKLLPGNEVEIGELSIASGEGKHTTTRAKVFHLPHGGAIIDSPGIRDFSLWHLSADELQFGFIEIANHATNCKFRNCQHASEPGCAVIQAVEQGKIHPQRFDNFVATRDAMANQRATGN